MAGQGQQQEDDRAYRSHSNKEKMVKCPYCDDRVLSRGLYMHVYNSGDGDHGGYQNVPDDFDSIEPETVGEREVTLTVPTHKEYDHELVMCKWCGDLYRGTHGLGTHLGRSRGDGQHPEDTTIEDSGIRVPATADNQPALTEEGEERIEEELEFDPDADIQELWQDAIAEGEADGLAYSNPPTEIDVTGSVPASSLKELADEFDRKAAKGEQADWHLAAERVRALLEREAS